MNRHRQGPLRARLGMALAGVVLITTALAGCSADAPEFDADTAQALQSGVLSVSVAAAAGDFATAQAELSAVRGTLASSADRLTASRTTTIQTAIDLVDADLAAAIAASAVPVEPDKPEETAKPQPSNEPAEPEKSKDPDKSEDSEDPATDQPDEDQQDEDESEKDSSDTDKNEKNKDNPGQCKKYDTCE